LESKARQIILDNIAAATTLNRNQLILKIQNFQHQTTLQLNLRNFITIYNIPIQLIYKRGGWSRLCQTAGVIDDFPDTYEKQIIAAITNKWLSTKCFTYFNFILSLAKQDFIVDLSQLSENEKKMLIMLHYDVWQNAGGFTSLASSILEIGRNKVLATEIIEVLEFLVDNLDFKEIEANLPYEQPLKLHARYTRDQILAAFGLSTFERKSPSREGIAENTVLNTELLFINLIKSEENFSPSTMYDDYAINESLFHWQSQNSAGPDTPKGIYYIEHVKNKKVILLFVREKNKDEFGSTMGYVFIGEGKLIEHNGAKPMNIKWQLNEPLPHYLWKDAAKLQVG
jgi:hypothetical protein